MVQAYILLIYWAWQAFHYGRQNTGIYSFASIATRKAPPDKYERAIIDLGTVFGILGTFKILGMAVAPEYLTQPFDLLYRFGACGVRGSSHRRSFLFTSETSNSRHLCLRFSISRSSAFFAGVFIDRYECGFLSATRSRTDVQYILFMTVVSLNFDPQNERHERLQIGNAIKLIVITVIARSAFL